MAAQPGIAEMFAPAQVAACFAAAANDAQPAWSLLFYALWYRSHIAQAAPERDVFQTLSSHG